jgi:hypothetical protein
MLGGRRSTRADTTMTIPADAGPRADVDEALAGLVHQFADPLAFLRELVQNAIDAGTSDVRITCSFAAKDDATGVTTIEVADSGCGMTREIIETQLTRLFASAKDGDHTKIGKFGIGFVSVFALDPDAVVIDTSREGEHWRVIFGKSRSYELRRLAAPIEGTRVRVIKATTRSRFDELRHLVPATVRKWCRHTACEIRVDDVAINEPIDLPAAPCRVTSTDGVTTIVAGHPRDGQSFLGFYNAGLTLFEANELPPWFGDPATAPTGIAVKASSPQLEHTLTRDKVIEDAGYQRVVARVRGLVHDKLGELAVAMLAVARERSTPERLFEYLCGAVRWHVQHGRAGLRSVWRMDVLRAPSGAGISLRRCAGRVRGREVLVATERSALTDVLERAGRVVVLVHGEHEVALVRATVRPGVQVAGVHERWCLAVPGERSDVDASSDVERALADALAALLGATGAKLAGITLGELGPPGSPAASLVAMTRPGPGAPVPMAAARTVGTWWLARRREIVVNRRHPIVTALLELVQVDRGLAAYLLAKAFWLGVRLDPRLDGQLARAAMEVPR